MVAASGSEGTPDVVCIGSAALDVLLTVERLPGADDRVAATDGMMAGGGPAATAAVTLARLGARVAIVARIGDDLTGRIIREQLVDEGVDVRWLVVGGDVARSALSSGVIRRGPPPTRSLVALPAHPALTIDALAPGALEVCRAAAWIHVDHAGWPLVTGLRTRGVTTRVSVDGGNPLADLDLSRVALYAPSMQELRRWTRAPDDETALGDALDAGARVVIATRGAEGASYAGACDPDAPWPVDTDPEPSSMSASGHAQGDARTARSASRWRLDVSAYPVEARSTLGAGDVYHGALLAALHGGATIRRAMTEASVAAGLSCLALDGRSAIPDRPSLETALGAWSPAPSVARRSDA